MFVGATRQKCSWLYLKNQCRNGGEKENGMSQKLYVQTRAVGMTSIRSGEDDQDSVDRHEL